MNYLRKEQRTAVLVGGAVFVISAGFIPTIAMNALRLISPVDPIPAPEQKKTTISLEQMEQTPFPALAAMII